MILDTQPVYSKKELYQLIQYLSFRTEDYAVGTHLCGDLQVEKRAGAFESIMGKAPAFIDFDMHSLPFSEREAIHAAARQLVAFAKKGGFIAITDHWLTPRVNYTQAAIQGAANSVDHLSREEFYAVMSDGTPFYQNFRDELGMTADFLRELRDNGVPVIYRPMHEGNADWFWWGVSPEKNIHGLDTAKLYRYVHDFFTVTCGLDNILWQFNVGINGCQDVLCDWYPGDAYVDLLSIDWYLPENDYKHYSEEMLQKCGVKPMAISEYGGDGNYNTALYPLRDTLSYAERFLDDGAKAAYIGLYFDLPVDRDMSLPARAIALDRMGEAWRAACGDPLPYGKSF